MKVTVVTLLMLEESNYDGDSLAGTYVFQGHGLDRNAIMLSVIRDFREFEPAVTDAEAMATWLADNANDYYVNILETVFMPPPPVSVDPLPSMGAL